MKLSEESCEHIEKGQNPLAPGQITGLLRDVPEWRLAGTSLEREFRFKGFDEAMEFVNEVAEVASAEDHHPDMCISYNRVSLRLTTHKIGGLSKNDFIMAAKISELPLPE